MGVRYGQLKGTIGKINGESRTPPFSQLRKRIKRLEVGADQNRMTATSDQTPQDTGGRRDRAPTGASGGAEWGANLYPVSCRGACHM